MQKLSHQLLFVEGTIASLRTQRLRRIRQLLGDHKLGECILKQQFLQRLPTNAQLTLAPTKETVAMDHLAVIANEFSR